MARSTRTTTTNNSRNATPTVTTPGSTEKVVRTTHKTQNYRFEYQRDRLSRRAGSSYFNVATADGTEFNMSLSEARSLYNFLNKALNG